MKIKTNGLRALPAVVLGALFLMLAMGLSLLSSGVYRRIVDEADTVSVRRTALSYLVNQTRRGDLGGGIACGAFGGSDALYLRENGYVTILYQHDGQLCELYMEQGAGLAPADGIAVAPLSALSITARAGVLDFAVTDMAGAVYTASVAPRCGLQEEYA